MVTNGTDHSATVDDALAAALERDAERRLDEAEQPSDHDRYMEWMTERAERALMLADEQDSVRIDFRRVPPRDEAQPVAEKPKADKAHEAGVALHADILERYTLTGEMDAADLLGMHIDPPRVIVEGILAAGTSVLAAMPKLGKSWMCVQLAVEVVLGGTFLDRKCEQGDVLYLPLEDGRGRTQSRLRKILAGRVLPRGKLTVRWDSPPLGDGMEAMIEEWLDAHPNAALVIIDTLGRVRTPGDGRRNAYQVDVEDVGHIQRLVRDRPISLVLVHHTKKGKEDDFVSQVSGTLGIAGSADTILLLHRKRHVDVGTLEVTSREMPEDEVAVRFVDGEWSSAPDALPGASPAKMAVYDAIMEHGPLWPIAIARLLRQERSAVQHHVSALLEEGAVIKTAGGYVSIEAESQNVH